MKNFTHQRPVHVVKSLALAIAVILVIVVNILRFYKTDQIPYGFHVDELSGAVTIQCLGTQGVDAHNRRYPVFGELNYGTPKPPTYLYPAMAWGKVFGYTVPSLRLLSAAVFIFSLIGLFFFARFFWGVEFALWTALAGSISPWMWMHSRVAIEPLLAPMFLVWGLYIFLRFRNVWAAMAAGVLFSGALYSYPPFRLYIPLMLGTLWFYTHKIKPVSRALWAIFLVAMILPAIPLAQKIINGEVQSRFNKISIASADYLQSIGKTNSPKDLFQIFTNNYFLHFSGEFLFFKGDPSLVHSTGHFGILSWLDMLGLVCLFILMTGVLLKKLKYCHDTLLSKLVSLRLPRLRQVAGRGALEGRSNPIVVRLLRSLRGTRNDDQWFLLFVLVNIALGIIPSAMTNTEMPNSLRIIASWPFVSLLTGYGIWRMSLRFPLVVPMACVLAAAIFASVFLKEYFYKYPNESAGMFSVWTKLEVERIKDDQGWLDFMYHYRNDDYHARYYLINYHGDTCRESKDLWDNLKKAWISLGVN